MVRQGTWNTPKKERVSEFVDKELNAFLKRSLFPREEKGNMLPLEGKRCVL